MKKIIETQSILKVNVHFVHSCHLFRIQNIQTSRLKTQHNSTARWARRSEIAVRSLTFIHRFHRCLCQTPLCTVHGGAQHGAHGGAPLRKWALQRCQSSWFMASIFCKADSLACVQCTAYLCIMVRLKNAGMATMSNPWEVVKFLHVWTLFRRGFQAFTSVQAILQTFCHALRAGWVACFAFKHIQTYSGIFKQFVGHACWPTLVTR